MATLPELLGAMRQKLGFEAVQKDMDTGRVYLLGRIRGQTIANMLVWTHRMLLSSKTTSWTADISQTYMLKNGQLVKAWRIIIQSSDVVDAIDQVMQVLRKTPAARQPELDTIPLPGATADRNMPAAPGARGAALTGQAIIGRR